MKTYNFLQGGIIMKRFFRKHCLTFMEKYYHARFKTYEWAFDHKIINDLVFIKLASPMLHKCVKYATIKIEEGLL